MSAILQCRGVGKVYDGPYHPRLVLGNIDLDIEEGAFLAITGPSGSGKSTFLNLCALLDEPSSGEISIQGHATANLDEASICALRARAVGMVFQQYCLLPGRTVLENVMFRFRYIAGAWPQARVKAEDALRRVGLFDLCHSSVNRLSGGEMQRVGIARAIAGKPRLLLADEPTGNLDSRSASEVMDLLAALNTAEKMAVLLVTHNEALLSYAGRHLQCRDGSLWEV